MADSSLDNFFAKKDKSKKSKSKKFGGKDTSTRSDESNKSEKPTLKDKDNAASSNTVPDDGEWKEFVEKQVDYSDLKIQSLQLSEKEKEELLEKERENELDENGEARGKDGNSGPWKMVGPNDEFEPPKQVEEIKKELNLNSGPAVYISPAVKRAANQEKAPMSRSRGPKTAPKLDCQSAFPSLSSAAITQKTDNVDERAFEQVKNRSRPRSDVNGRNTGARLDLDNKYNALQAHNL